MTNSIKLCSDRRLVKKYKSAVDLVLLVLGTHSSLFVTCS